MRKSKKKNKDFRPKGDWVGWTLYKLTNVMMGGDAGYSERKVASVNREDNNGIGVSTCWFDDFNCYETALLDANGVHPVERYRTKKEARINHKKWTKFAKSADNKKVFELGDNDFFKDKKITLVRKEI